MTRAMCILASVGFHGGLLTMTNHLILLDNHILSINLTETWDWKVPSNQPGGSFNRGYAQKRDEPGHRHCSAQSYSRTSIPWTPEHEQDLQLWGSNVHVQPVFRGLDTA